MFLHDSVANVATLYAASVIHSELPLITHFLQK